MKVTVNYRGTTSSGKMHKYQVLFPTMPEVKDAAGVVTQSSELATEAKRAEILAALGKDGVEFNKNLGNDIFLSSTHLHLTSKLDKTAEVDVRGMMDQRDNSRTINWFADIDKEAQRLFIKQVLVNQEVGDILMVETALTAGGTAIDVEKFEKIKLLKLQQKKLNKEIDAIIVGE